MPRLVAIAALPALLVFGTSDAYAARPLLAELLARAPVKAGQPAMSPLALEACLLKARELDTTGTAIDYEIAAIDRETAEGRTAMWNWFVAHYDQILVRIGTFASGRLPGMAGGGGCSQAEAERMTQFFTPRLKELSGADRGLAQSTESTLLCAALKAKQDPTAIMK